MDTIKHNSKTIKLKGQAYLDANTKHGFHYTTLATDETGKEYRLIWLVTDETLMFDADECCDWSQPDYVVPQ